MSLLIEKYYWLDHSVVLGDGGPLFSTGFACGYLRSTTPWSYSFSAKPKISIKSNINYSTNCPINCSLGYPLKGASQSKAAETAKEELPGGFWKWVRPWFITDVPEVEEKPETAETETKTYEKLLELIKEQKFFDDLARRVTELQKAGIREKNIVRGCIEDMEEITIGDKVYSPTETYRVKVLSKVP